MTLDHSDALLDYMPDHKIDHHRRTLLTIGFSLVTSLIFTKLFKAQPENISEPIKYIGDNSYVINGWVIHGDDLYPHRR